MGTGREAIKNSILTLVLLNDPRSRAAAKRVRSRRIQESFLHAREKCVRTKLFFCVSPLVLSCDSLPLVQVHPFPRSLAQLVHRQAHARLNGCSKPSHHSEGISNEACLASSAALARFRSSRTHFRSTRAAIRFS